MRNKTTDAYNPKLPDVRNKQDRIRNNQNQKEVEESDSPRKTIKQTNIFFGIEFQNKTQLNNYMNKSDISINDINMELDLLGEEKQKTKKDGQKILLGHFLRTFIPTPTKQGKVLTKRLYINSKHFLDEGELEKNNLVMKSNNTNRIIYNMKPVKITKSLKEVILLTLQKNFNKEKYNKLTSQEKDMFKRFLRSSKINTILEDDEQDEMNDKRFHILLGEIKAGNNNIEMIKELRKYALKAFNEGKISRSQLNNILLDISVLI